MTFWEGIVLHVLVSAAGVFAGGCGLLVVAKAAGFGGRRRR